nr:MAG TPA: hypothetical protein [Caudoviricetes sp.]
MGIIFFIKNGFDEEGVQVLEFDSCEYKSVLFHQKCKKEEN